MIPCRSQELLPFPSVMYFFLQLFSINYSSILPHFILPSISCSTSQSCCSKFICSALLGILFSTILCTCPNQHNSIFYHSLYMPKPTQFSFLPSSVHVQTNVIYLTLFSKFTLLQASWPWRGGRGTALPILNLGTRRGWVVSTTPQPLYPRERPGTHCAGGWVGPRAGLDVCEKSHPYQDSVPGLSSP
jgi:hypothetical protein